MSADDATLTEAEREALDVMGMFPTSQGFAQPADWERDTETRLVSRVERILADRLAAVRAEADVERMTVVSLHGITAHATRRAESAERRLAEVEALLHTLRTFALVRSKMSGSDDKPMLDNYGKGVVRACDEIAAALATKGGQS